MTTREKLEKARDLLREVERDATDQDDHVTANAAYKARQKAHEAVLTRIHQENARVAR